MKCLRLKGANDCRGCLVQQIGNIARLEICQLTDLLDMPFRPNQYSPPTWASLTVGYFGYGRCGLATRYVSKPPKPGLAERARESVRHIVWHG